ncbi:MAG TPA: zinc ABC transporter substrate-binding protein, partial [Limnochordia bacterium]
MPRWIWLGAGVLLLLLIAFAVLRKAQPVSAPRQGPLRVVTTTGMIADAVKNVGGPYVEVTALMGPGVDPHLYKATQGDLRTLAQADVIVYNGLALEGKMGDIFVKMASQVPTFAVTETIPEELLREPPEFQGHYDPHVWFDVPLWIRCVEHIRDRLAEIDPAHAADYRRQAAAYIETLRALDAEIRAEIATLPEAQRVLVTAH